MEHINQLEAGTLLVGRYTIVRRVGGGGMGSVYLARDKRLAEANRAVKEMIGMFTDEASRKKAIEDFERESQLLASLDHPAIPTIYDYFVFEGCYYLVMKYINGGDLSGQLKDAPEGFIDERTVTQWGIEICDVLSYLHLREPPIIYRDMKPANVMLDERKRVMLVDFGIARFVAPTQKNVTAIGTMGYAPPELFAGRVEPRSDLYSVGATMFHLLTGRDPQDNPLLMFDFNRNPKPTEINPLLTQGIEEILIKSVEHKPASRFASAADMKQALEEHLKYLDRPKSVAVPSVSTGSASAGTAGGIFCGNCGHALSGTDVFCNNCGSLNPAALPPASLVLTGSNNQPVTFQLSKDSNLVGRLDTNRGIYPDIDLTPFDKEGKVSRRHAFIYRETGQYFLEDYGSTNGTFINNEDRLPPKERRLIKPGDDLRFGDIVLKFILGPATAASQSPPNNPSPPSVGGSHKNHPTDVSGSKAHSMHSASVAPALAATGEKMSMHASSSASSAATADEVTLTPDNVESSKHSSDQKSSSDAKAVHKKEAPTGKTKERLITDIEFPKQVKLGQNVELHVGLSAINNGVEAKKAHNHDCEFEVTIDHADGPGTKTLIDAYIAAPGFEIEPEIFARLPVPFGGNSPPAIFQLKGLQTGSTTITIDFFLDPDCISSVSLETEIVD
jgi:eukaryotic-like serine/threonine-protein kinase